MKIKDFLTNARTYLALPEMKLFWILLGLIVLNAILSLFFLRPLLWLLVGGVIWITLAIAVFWSGLRAARSNLTLNLERHHLSNIITNLKDGVVVYDQNFKILVFNPAAETIFNLKASEVVGQVFTLKVKQPSENARYKLLLSVLFPALAPVVHRLSDPSAEVQVADLSFDDPPMDLRVTTAKIYNPDGGIFGYMKVIRDRTRDLLILRSKSEFVTVASHQLRAPLTAVSWAFETLQKESSMNESQKDLVRIGVQAAGSLLKIVNDLLDVAKIEEGRFGYQFQEINIVAFLEDVLKQAEIVARQYRVKVYFERPREGDLKVIGDSQRLGTAISNILDNSIKYNVPNGQVVVRVESLSDQPFVQVSVQDTGVGIPPEVIGKLFTKFFRAENALKQVTEGTGLGLFITRNVIRRHGGKVWAKSELNRGSTFFLTLPTRQDLIPLKEAIYEEEM